MLRKCNQNEWNEPLIDLGLRFFSASLNISAINSIWRMANLWAVGKKAQPNCDVIHLNHRICTNDWWNLISGKKSSVEYKTLSWLHVMDVFAPQHLCLCVSENTVKENYVHSMSPTIDRKNRFFFHHVAFTYFGYWFVEFVIFLRRHFSRCFDQMAFCTLAYIPTLQILLNSSYHHRSMQWNSKHSMLWFAMITTTGHQLCFIRWKEMKNRILSNWPNHKSMGSKSNSILGLLAC